MHFSTSLRLFALTALYSLAIGDTSQNPALVAKLRMAGTQLDRLEILPNDDTDWYAVSRTQHYATILTTRARTFDFTKQPGYTFKPASVVSANGASFPVGARLRLRAATQRAGPRKLT